MNVDVAVRRLPDSDPAIPLPKYQTAGAAGMDVHANLPASSRGGVTLAPGERKLVPSGLSVAIPPGFEIQVRPRSGLAFKHGVTVANAPGTIDSDYRGELGILLINLGQQSVSIRHGDRIAQLVLAPVSRCQWVETALVETERGIGGFGSTGAA